MTYQLLTAEELDKLHEIHRLLEEANSHSLEQDGYCKSSEGHIEVGLGNHWDRLDPADRKPPTVSIYSYLLGPHRQHHFDSIDQALEVVQQWHRREMTDSVEPDLYMEIEAHRDADGRESWDYFESIFNLDADQVEG